MLDLFRAVFAPPRDLILLVASGWLGLWLAGKHAQHAGADEKELDSLLTWMSVAFVVGGRLLFAAGHLQAFVQSPVSLVSLNVDLFDPWSGILCAAIIAAVLIQRRRLPARHFLDLMVPFLATLSIGLGLSHLASGEAFGRETNAPWGIVLWGATRQPTQLYEIVAGILILVLLWLRRENGRPGRTFLLWGALTAAGRLLIEAFRGDSTLVFGGLRLAQIIAWLTLAAALVGMELLPAPQPAPAVLAAETNKKRTVPSQNRAP